MAPSDEKTGRAAARASRSEAARRRPASSQAAALTVISPSEAVMATSSEPSPMNGSSSGWTCISPTP